VEGVNGNMDWSSRDMVDTYSSYEDEVDIVGEG
jgi:hypothetical protein